MQSVDHWYIAKTDETMTPWFIQLLVTRGLAHQFLELVNTSGPARGLLIRCGTAVDAANMSPSSATQNRTGMPDPEMHYSKKAN